MLFTGEEIFFKHLLIKFDKIVLNYVKSGKKSRIFRFLKFDLDMMKIPRDNGVGRANKILSNHFLIDLKIVIFQVFTILSDLNLNSYSKTKFSFLIQKSVIFLTNSFYSSIGDV